MKTLPIVFMSFVCSSVLAASALAQNSGGTSGASGSGSSGTSPRESSSPSSASRETKKKGPPPEAQAVGKSGGPVSPANLPARTKRDEPKPPAEPLPEGLTVPPLQPGISPVSGLPTAELPAVSPGTQPLGPRSRPATSPAGTPVVDAPAPDVTRQTLDATRTAPTHLPPGAALPTEPRAPVTVPSAPPIAHPEIAPPSRTNERGERWIGGHHSWTEGQWQWVEGGWQRPPAANAEWVAGHYDAASKRWTEGYWRTPTPVAKPGK